MNDDFDNYLKANPHYYIVLSRYPEKYSEIYQEYKGSTKKSLATKLDQLNMLLNMINMLR